jgi:hypothetical protein
MSRPFIVCISNRIGKSEKGLFNFARVYIVLKSWKVCSWYTASCVDITLCNFSSFGFVVLCYMTDEQHCYRDQIFSVVSTAFVFRHCHQNFKQCIIFISYTTSNLEFFEFPDIQTSRYVFKPHFVFCVINHSFSLISAATALSSNK